MPVVCLTRVCVWWARTGALTMDSLVKGKEGGRDSGRRDRQKTGGGVYALFQGSDQQCPVSMGIVG